jgi:hypothetical protein
MRTGRDQGMYRNVRVDFAAGTIRSTRESVLKDTSPKSTHSNSGELRTCKRLPLRKFTVPMGRVHALFSVHNVGTCMRYRMHATEVAMLHIVRLMLRYARTYRGGSHCGAVRHLRMQRANRQTCVSRMQLCVDKIAAIS